MMTNSAEWSNPVGGRAGSVYGKAGAPKPTAKSIRELAGEMVDTEAGAMPMQEAVARELYDIAMGRGGGLEPKDRLRAIGMILDRIDPKAKVGDLPPEDRGPTLADQLIAETVALNDGRNA